ncbi:acyl-CoA dehydrogenase [Citrobacter koseri]|uniref:acyl-CoA dehydrogenase n=1 Tax=Citrobacter koseri TaxID=545 RepID=UPI0022321591|nr:acyl-CoA dehydrogenase [Citrobacter koseri]MDM9064858.1 acyl-CoA dehydrogenase [Citrobacter koseri]MDM9081129.1 acyl-CoA dehydrogenase [Citrobacter koseri]MDM9091312.1 acyl-CoA dehydrogenase [Citrobacter koseri]MDM9093558.1 acyl-CoA dehydrogenase [Citrobacter koseri]MDM9267739.1 acyl-CoA dehydrogenase [Citrobacter koseri]
MKKILIASLLISSSFSTYADEYIKRNGALILSHGNGFVEFSINVSRSNASVFCNVKGVAISIDASARQRNRWVYSDSLSACVIVISELNDDFVNVASRNCENYCSISSVDSINGKYMRK